MTHRSLAQIEDRETDLEERLCRLIGKCRGARSDVENRNARRALAACIEWIDRAGFNGVGIQAARQDIALRGLHIQQWWQASERGSERLEWRRRA
jgi:hypothetical protein